MFTTMLLSSWLASGQAPTLPTIPMPAKPVAAPQAAPSAAVPMPMPMSLPKVMPAPVANTPAAPSAPTAPTVITPAPTTSTLGVAAPVMSAPVYGVPVMSAPVAEAAPAEAEAPAEPTKYFSQKLLEGTAFGQRLADAGVSYYGWTAMNYTASSTSRRNGPITFNNFANDFQLNQNWFEVTKAIDTSKKEVQLGYKVSTLFYGTDYFYTLSRGLLNYQQEDNRKHGWDVVYHYGEIFMPNLGGEGSTLRVGRWGTLIGYEVIDAVNTPFVSKSYNFQYNPFTHTGAMLTTQINENLSMYHGVVTGSDVYIDPAARATYVGGIKLAPKDGKGSIAFNTVIGPTAFLAKENVTHFNSYNLLVTYNVSDKLTYVLDATFSHADKFEPNVDNNFEGGSSHWYGFANYFIYKVSDKLTSNLRVELFDDVNGVRTGFKGVYTGVTYGLTYTPKDWLLIRPFVRYDYNSRSRPFEGDRDIFLGGVEAIVRW